MDTAQWPQEIGMMKSPSSMEGMVSSNACSTRPMSNIERKARPTKEQALNCPRCNSTNTKFCYYNNYSLTQPRYFCKTCRRYWTEGGSLRNVPVGGGSRKNKRTTTTSTTPSSSSSKKLLDHHDQNPKFIHQGGHGQGHVHGHDLNLSFPIQEPSYHTMSQEYVDQVSSNTSNSLSALELLRSGITSRGLNSFMPMPIPDSNTSYSSGFAMQDFKPTLDFGVNGGYDHESSTNGGRLLFPFEDLRQVSNANEGHGNGDHSSSAGYWSGMLGGGSWQ